SYVCFVFSSRRRHTILVSDWSSDVCSSDLQFRGPPIVYTSRRTAELIKYAANAFLATKITFINEVADLCERVGADIQEVAHGIRSEERRVGKEWRSRGRPYH